MWSISNRVLPPACNERGAKGELPICIFSLIAQSKLISKVRNLIDGFPQSLLEGIPSGKCPAAKLACHFARDKPHAFFEPLLAWGYGW